MQQANHHFHYLVPTQKATDYQELNFGQILLFSNAKAMLGEKL